MVPTTILMVIDMKANGNVIFRMALAPTTIPTETSTRENGLTANNMEKETTSTLRIRQSIKATGKRDVSKAQASWSSRISTGIQDNGEKTARKALELTSSLMVSAMKEAGCVTRNMGQGLTDTVMGIATLVNGVKIIGTEKAQ